MKILIDPVYTGRASTCSTSYLAWEIIKHFVKFRDDVFFYLTYPRSLEKFDDEMDFLHQNTDRVHLIPLEGVHTDRMSELFCFPRDLMKAVQPGARTWDIDAVVTSRIPQGINFRVNTARAITFTRGTHRLLLGLDEMPLFSFRSTVSWGNTGHIDLASLAAYDQYDEMIVTNLWSKDRLDQVARKNLSPSKVISLMSRVNEAVPVPLTKLDLKPPERRPKPGETFNVAFCGRLTGSNNFDKVVEVFRKHFSFGFGKEHVRFVVSTQSTGNIQPAKVGESDFIVVENNNREQFHKFLKHEAHVMVRLTDVEDFSLSTYEPLTFGVPAIVPDVGWSEFLGPNYPFRVSGMAKVHGMLSAFLKDYEEMYSRFEKWATTEWEDIVAGPANTMAADYIERALNQREDDLDKFFFTDKPTWGQTYRDIAAKIDAADMGVVDLVPYCEEQGLIEKLAKDMELVPVGRRPLIYVIRLLLLRMGWKDTVSPGMMMRI